MAKMKMVSEKIESKNKVLVLEAFDTLFNKRDYAALSVSGRLTIFNTALISRLDVRVCSISSRAPPTLRYEPGTIVAEGDLVIVHGRFSGFGAPVNWIAADIVRIQNGILVEHWTSFRMK